MRWLKPNLRSSLHAIFGSTLPPPPAATELEVGIEDIREAMLALISSVGEERFAHVTRRVRYATDVQALWFMRGDLMAVLASSCGESAALEKIEGVSDMFENLLPQGLRSRPSPLSGGTKG
jgi:hypothetical protein